MIVTVFRGRLREGADLQALGAVGERMAQLAATMPGFIAYKDFAAADGESVTIIEFATEAQMLAWRNHAEHVVAQQRGREEFFAEYQIQVCRLERAYRFTPADGRRTLAL